MDQNEQKEIPKLTSKQKVGCIGFLVVFLVAFFLYRENQQKKLIAAEDQEFKDYQAQLLKDEFKKFAADSLNEGGVAKLAALNIIDDYQGSEECKICMNWAGRRNIDINQIRRTRDKQVDSAMNASLKDVEENGYQPTDDEAHYGAFDAAKHFIKIRLKAPASASFDDEYQWAKTSYTNEEYKFTIKVDSQNSFGAMLRSVWVVRVYSQGDQWLLKSAVQID